MRVHLIKKQTVEDYARKFGYKNSFEEWLTKVKYADWKTPQDIIKTYNSADLLGKGSHRVVFNIAGNNCRMICKFRFTRRRVHLFVCWIGNHAEYDELCKASMQYTVNAF